MSLVYLSSRIYVRGSPSCIVCLVPGHVDKYRHVPQIAPLNRASTHILRAFYSADIGIVQFSSPLDSIACCLMLMVGRPISQRNFQLSATAQPNAT